MQYAGFAQLPQHDGKATRIVEIFHEVFARRLQINQARQARSQPIPVIELKRHANPPGDRDAGE